VVVVVALALVLAVVVGELLEELPHAASATLASTRTTAAIAGLLLLVWI
jgi:hypothetical protein